jgi:alpha-N-arabinofuranosidase
VYYYGAKPYSGERVPVVKDEDPDLRVLETGDEVFIEVTLSPARTETQLVTTERLGKAQVPNLPYTDFDGRRIELDTDYFGKKRNMKQPTPGPFESISSGRQKIKVWPNKGI